MNTLKSVDLLGFRGGTVENSGAVIRLLNRCWVEISCLVGTLLLSGCLNTLPTQPESGFDSKVSVSLEFPVPLNQRKDATDLFWDGLQARPADGTTNAPQKTTNLWQRIRVGLQVPLPGGEAAQRVARHERWYLENPAHLQRTFSRARLYLFDIVEAVEKEGLPMEVALLPAVESAFIPMARSSAAAEGLWQFIAPTGRRFDLKQHMFSDERRNVRAATQAAMRYLKELQARYDGDFQLALAAYNCGEGCIDSHVRRAKARGLPGRFEDLELNSETANYVPRLLALAKLLSAAVDSENMAGITLPAMVNAPYFVATPIHRDMDVKLAAKFAGMPLDAFMALNPQHKKPVIVAATNAEVLVPVDRAAGFQEAVASYRGALSSWTTVKIAQPSSIQKLAQTHGANAEAIRMVNNIPRAHLVVAGSTLLVPRNSVRNDISMTSVESAVLMTTPEMVMRKLVVRKNEGWPSVAKRLGVELSQLQAWNPKIKSLRRGTMQVRLPATLGVAYSPTKPV